MKTESLAQEASRISASFLIGDRRKTRVWHKLIVGAMEESETWQEFKKRLLERIAEDDFYFVFYGKKYRITIAVDEKSKCLNCGQDILPGQRMVTVTYFRFPAEAETRHDTLCLACSPIKRCLNLKLLPKKTRNVVKEVVFRSTAMPVAFADHTGLP